MALNNIILQGRLVRDPEVKETSNGIKRARFTIAVNRNYSKDSTDFIDCVAWRGTADFVGNYFFKGKEILVEGSLETRSYTGKDGSSKKAFEVKADSVYFTAGSKEKAQAEPAQQTFEEITEPDDGELPF